MTAHNTDFLTREQTSLLTGQMLVNAARALAPNGFGQTKPYKKHDGMNQHVSFIWDALCMAGVDAPVPHISTFSRVWQVYDWLESLGFQNVARWQWDDDQWCESAHPSKHRIMTGDLIVAPIGNGFTIDLIFDANRRDQSWNAVSGRIRQDNFLRHEHNTSSRTYRAFNVLVSKPVRPSLRLVEAV